MFFAYRIYSSSMSEKMTLARASSACWPEPDWLLLSVSTTDAHTLPRGETQPHERTEEWTLRLEARCLTGHCYPRKKGVHMVGRPQNQQPFSHPPLPASQSTMQNDCDPTCMGTGECYNWSASAQWWSAAGQQVSITIRGEYMWNDREEKGLTAQKITGENIIK